jgi:hypothetical protein
MSRIWRGSSALANCSAKSPVSVQSEKSDPAEEIEERRLPFSLADSSTRVEALRGGDCKGRKGMLEEVRGDDVGGMLAVWGG